MNTTTERYRCPKCAWEFALRKKRRCATCVTLLLVPSDKIPDNELGILSSFWMWDPAKKKWVLICNWEEHKRQAMKKFDEYIKNSTST